MQLEDGECNWPQASVCWSAAVCHALCSGSTSLQSSAGTIIEELDEIEPGDVLIAAVSEAKSGAAAAGPDLQASATAATAAEDTRETQPDPLFSGIARRLEARERATTISGSLKMLRRILENTAKPEPKFRRIPFTNEKVRSKIGTL